MKVYSVNLTIHRHQALEEHINLYLRAGSVLGILQHLNRHLPRGVRSQDTIWEPWTLHIELAADQTQDARRA